MKSIFNRKPKTLIAAAVLFLVTLFGVGAISLALLGGSRPVKSYNGPGTPGFDHVTFNSFTNVPNIGDERNFFHGKIDGAPNGFYDPMNGVRAGDEILMRVYVHNGADPKYNASGKGVAHNTRVSVTLPTTMAQKEVSHAFVSADNASPKIVEDTLTINGLYPVGLQYVPGSATIKTNYQDRAISDNIVKGGVLIGDKDLSGTMPGCFDHVALVTFKVKVVAPSYTLEKKVSLNGADKFTKSVTTKPGSKVDFVLGFKNVGSTNLNHVVVGDKLPKGFTYVPGTTQFISGATGNKWVKSTSNNLVVGGLDIGQYAPGGAGYVKFTAQVADESKLACGMNQLVNTGYAKPQGLGTIQDTAVVDTNKVCVPSQPVFTCDLLNVETSEGRNVSAKVNVTAKNGATFKMASFDFGDGTSPLVTDQKTVKHTYAADGTYNIAVKTTFTVNGSDKTVTSASCAQSVTFKSNKPVPTPTTPKQLTNTGAGDVAGIFTGTSLVGAFLHRKWTLRRSR